MAKLEPIEIKIDQDAVKAQIHDAITQALADASFKLRWAADALFPQFQDDQEKWIEEQIQKRVKVELEKRAGDE